MNPDDHKHSVVDRIVRLARIDPRLCGCMLLGTAAQEQPDDCGHVELCMLVYNDYSVADVFTDWRRRLCAILPAHSVECTADADSHYLLSLLLSGLTEVRVRFICGSDLQATGATWHVLFDRVGDLDWRMKVLWVKKTAARRVVPELEERVASIRHRVFLAQAALETGRLWQSLVDIEDIRKRIIDLHALRTGEDVLENRAVDAMEPAFLENLEATICAALTRSDVARALQAAIECFLGEVRAADSVYDLHAAEQVQSLLQGLACCV